MVSSDLTLWSRWLHVTCFWCNFNICIFSFLIMYSLMGWSTCSHILIKTGEQLNKYLKLWDLEETDWQTNGCRTLHDRFTWSQDIKYYFFYLKGENYYTNMICTMSIFKVKCGWKSMRNPIPWNIITDASDKSSVLILMA